MIIRLAGMVRGAQKQAPSTAIPPFNGYPREGMLLLEQLAENNEREWFEPRKAEYRETLMLPSQSLAVSLGSRLQQRFPGFILDTSLGGRGSVMKIYRDVRFSSDKRPYYDYMRVLFWHESRPRMRGPSLLFWIEAQEAGFMGGVWGFSRSDLERYRRAVKDPHMGKSLQRAITKVQSAEGYVVKGQTFVKVPRGFDPDHQRANLLKYSGLFVNSPPIEPAMFTRPELVDVCCEHADVMKPVVDWLVHLSAS